MKSEMDYPKSLKVLSVITKETGKVPADLDKDYGLAFVAGNAFASFLDSIVEVVTENFQQADYKSKTTKWR